MTREKRRYQRYNLDVVEVSGKMSMSDKVEIVDISLGGVGIKADRRLNMDREYLLKLTDKGKTLDVRGIVVRSELVGIEPRQDGEMVSIYMAGLKFVEGSADKIAAFLKPLAEHKKEAAPDVINKRRDVRFNITASRERVLSYPEQFRVKTISLGGMCIKTLSPLVEESRIPLEFSLHEGVTVKLAGRVASCRAMEYEGKAYYEIGVEFVDLTNDGEQSLMTFMEYLLEKGVEPA